MTSENGIAKSAESYSVAAGLTERGLQVLVELASGFKRSEAAEHLLVKNSTINYHFWNIGKHVSGDELEHRVMVVMVGAYKEGVLKTQGLVPVNSNLHLSGREKEVLNLSAKGLTDLQICSSLTPVVSYHTVRTHMRSIKAKLKAKNRFHAVAISLEAGLINGE